MAPRISDELRARIIELLGLHGNNASEVHRQLRDQEHPVKVGVSQIKRVADSEKILLRAGRPKGLRMPGVGGRPRGEGKKTSPHRAPAEKMAEQGLKDGAIAQKLGITRQAVEQLLAPWKAARAEKLTREQTANGDADKDGARK